MLRQPAGEIWMAFEILVRPPMRIPAGVKQHGFAAQFQLRGICVDRALIARGRADHHASRFASDSSSSSREILPIRVTVERAVDIRAGIRHQLDLADLKLGPLA